MKSTLIVILLVFAFGAVNAQWYIKPRAISTALNSCNNIAVCEIYGMSGNGFAELNIGPAPSLYPTFSISHGDTIYDFCIYDQSNPNHHQASMYSSNGYIHTFLTYSTLITPEFNYTITSYIEPTDETSLDGSLIIEFDSAVTSYNLNIFQDDTVPTVSILDAYSLSLTGINKGFLAIYVQDPSNIYNYAVFTIYAGDPNEDYVNSGLDVSISFQHANSSCDGWINLQPLNTVGNVYNSWSDSVSNEFTRIDLCPGVYDVYTYEMISGSYAAASIDTIVITDNNTVYIDSNLFSIIPQDTSYYFDVSCTFDYSAPIDSVFYSEDTISFSGGLLIATFEMILYQGNNMVTISDSLITLSDSTVLLDIVVYCTLFKAEDFMGRRIMFLRGVDDHFFTQPYLDIPAVEKKSKAKVYPVPTNDELTIDFGQVGNYTLTIVDLQGKNHYSDNVFDTSETRIETETWRNGVYILTIQSENTIDQHQFIKVE